MSDLERLGEGLDVILRRIGLPEVPDLGRLADNWESLAGEPFGTRSRPVGLSGGTLVLEVADGASATLLRYQTGALLQRLETRFGAPIATDIRFRVELPKTRP